MATPIISSFTWLRTSEAGGERRERWTRHEGEEGERWEKVCQSPTPPMTLMETRKQEDFCLVCLREKETQKDSSVTMTNGISSTGTVNIKCLAFSTEQYCTVLSAKRGNEWQGKHCSEDR